MLTRVISMQRICRVTKRSPPYIRALSAAGILDCYVADNGRRLFPLHGPDQVRAYETKRKAEERAA
jgi:hypothetical protein